MTTATGTTVLPGSELYGRIAQFLNIEAEQLDTYKFAEWLENFTPDIEYRMPVRTTQFLTDGEGFNVKLDMLPLNGAEIVIRKPKPEEAETAK